MSIDLLFARRSIYGNKLNTIGYQILFENPNSDAGSYASIPDRLTTEYLAELFSEDGAAVVVGIRKVLINFSAIMLETFEYNLPKRQLLIGIYDKYLELEKIDLKVLTDARQEGYKIALHYSPHVSNHSRILPYADIIILDASKLSHEELSQQIKTLRTNNQLFMAKNIQARSTYDHCISVGFDYCEGYFLYIPSGTQSAKVSSDRLATLRLLAALDDENITLQKIEDLLSQDPRLSYRLIREVNSVSYGLSRAIKSIKEAVMLVGINQLRSRASMIILTSLDVRPIDVMMAALVRARMCELVSSHLGVEDSSVYFTAGLFSTLDALLDRSMEQVIQEIKLVAELTEALLHRKGNVGIILQNVIAYERAEWEELLDSGVEPDVWCKFYIESVIWAENSFKEG